MASFKDKGHYIMLFLLIAATIITFLAGMEHQQQLIEDRALSLKPQGHYHWQDIEYIIFGEIQE
jgi:hypothetical protein